MTTDFPTAPLAPGHKGAGGGAVEKSHHRLTHKKPDAPFERDATPASRLRAPQLKRKGFPKNWRKP